jgi:hypothetical protein
MKLEVIRKEFSPISTIGELHIDDVYFCYTLEDTIREVKIQNETAIPYGTYEVVITPSKRFQRDMPLLLNVPNFEGVRMHKGNTDKDTDGCILLGMSKSKDFIGHSALAFDTFFPFLEKALQTDKVFITVRNG